MKFPVKVSLVIKATASIIGLIVITSFLFTPLLMGLNLGQLLNPIGGIWEQTRFATYPVYQEIRGSGHSGTVLRDHLGIPHIFGETVDDISFMMGYCQAQDRLFAMDMQKRLLAGRLAETLGDDSGNVDQDKYMRVLGFYRLGEAWWDKIVADSGTDAEAERIRSGVEAYCGGINFYIDELAIRRVYPIEYLYVELTPEKWTPEECMMNAKFLAFTLGFSGQDVKLTQMRDAYNDSVTREMVPTTPFPFEDLIIPNFSQPSDFDDGNPIYTSSSDSGSNALVKRLQSYANDLAEAYRMACSNNWVVNGSLTESGKPILCGDPHLPLQLPPVWYEVQATLTSTGESFYGVTFPGPGPMIEIGQTQDTAWAATVSAWDATDYFHETFSADGSQYLFNSTGTPEWRDVESVTEEIKVKGGATVNYQINFTVHNNTVNGTPIDNFGCPIVTDIRGRFGLPQSYENCSVKWTGFMDDYGMVKGFYRLGFSKNYYDFRDAMEVMSLSGQNFVFADSSGNIAMFPRSFYPVRNETGTVKEGRYIMNGSSGLDEWSGYIPFNWTPNKVNPDQCYLVSANHRPVNHSEYTEYYTSYGFDDGYRGRRINDLIRNASATGWNITSEIMMRFQTDVYDVAAEVFVPELLNAYYLAYPTGIANATEPLNQTVEKLLAWNNTQAIQYQMYHEEVAPTIFDEWLSRYMRATLNDEFSAKGLNFFPQTIYLENLTRYDKNSIWFNDTTQAGTQDANDIMLLALNQTISYLAGILGTNIDEWDWGKRHQLEIRYLGFAGESMMPLFDYPVIPWDGSGRVVNVAGGHMVHGGPSMRMIIDFGMMASGSIYSGYLAVPGGQSGNPISPHYSDNYQYWKNNQYHPILFPRSISQMEPFAKYTAIFR